MDAHTLDLSVLPAQRRRFLATVGRRLTAQALQWREPQRRYPILLTLLAQSATDVLDVAGAVSADTVHGQQSRSDRGDEAAASAHGKFQYGRSGILREPGGRGSHRSTGPR